MRLYGATLTAASWLHYAVLSKFSHSDEGGAAWFRRRLLPKLPTPPEGARCIWIHAVSAGESKIAEALRAALLARDAKLFVVLSSTTYAGFNRVLAIAGDANAFIMPLDTITAQRRVFAALRPQVLVLVESEYWPAQFAAAAEADVPVVVVNATLSERSFAGHRRFPALTRATVLKARQIHAQSNAIAERYLSLGVMAEQVSVCGNLKLAAPNGASAVAKPAIRPLLVFGNIHIDEAAAIAPAVRDLRQRHPDLRLALVPRYPGKYPLDSLAPLFGDALRIVDSLDGFDAAGDLVWVNAMGVLDQLYGQASLAVVCGTFDETGGHDLAEPLHRGALSIYGPNVSRQRPMHEALMAAGCSVQVNGGDALVDMVSKLLSDPARREALIARFSTLSAGAAQSLDAIAADLIAVTRG